MLENIKNHSPKFKDTLIFAGWIVGILLFGGLLWYLSQDFRAHRTIRTVNAVLIQHNDDRRLQSSLPHNPQSRKIFQNYERFSLLNSAGSAVIMTKYDNTIPFVFAAFLNPNGNIQDILPLDNHSAQTMKRIDEKKITLYKAYIEETERQIRSEE
jgi:hypothetical protein